MHRTRSLSFIFSEAMTHFELALSDKRFFWARCNGAFAKWQLSATGETAARPNTACAAVRNRRCRSGRARGCSLRPATSGGRGASDGSPEETCRLMCAQRQRDGQTQNLRAGVQRTQGGGRPIVMANALTHRSTAVRELEGATPVAGQSAVLNVL